MISKFLNNHWGQTCVIIGNGPSLRDVPNAFLDEYPTFGANKIYLKYIPTYYVAVNPLVISQNKSVIEMLPCEKFVREGMIMAAHQLHISPVKEFSKEPHRYIYEGYTVTFVSLQLAYFFGFTTVLLVGVDHRYKFAGKPNEKNFMNTDDPNHFDASYFRGQDWNNPDLAQSEISYTMAKSVFEADNRKIINLTSGSDLKVFEFGDISDYE
jgi:hypothetical protein